MITNAHTTPRPVEGISRGDAEKIHVFLQGAVYCWCKNRKDEWFSLRDLMGGDNYYWEGTPLIALYNKHVSLNSADSVKAAGMDCGALLKSVICMDSRRFETRKAGIGLGRQYKWLPSADLKK